MYANANDLISSQTINDENVNKNLNDKRKQNDITKKC